MKRILTVLTLVVVMIALPMSAAYAEKPIPVSGETNQTLFDIFNPVAVVKEANGNVFLEVNIVDEWTPDPTTGGIYGVTEQFTASFVIRNWGVPYGEGCNPLGFCEDTVITVHQVFTFEDPIILTEVYVGTMTMKANILAKGQGLEGHWEIIDGTGELKNVHGQGTLSIIPNPNQGGPPVLHVYEGQIHFDPKDK